MMNLRRIPLCLLLVIALSLAVGASARGESIMSKNKVPGQVESKARRLIHDLKKQGFEVSRGYFKLWTVEDCQYTFDKMGTCYGNNPAAPYVVATLPAWPEESVDPDYSDIWGASLPGYHDVYRFDRHEALVILGQLPPPAAYFSEQTWLFTREGTYDENDSRYQKIEEEVGDFVQVFFQQVPYSDPERYVAFSSLSNIVNNVVIERQSGSAFDQTRYFIITPDKFMDKAVRKSLRNISVAKKDVFTEPIPSDMNIGLDRSADDFTTWMRYAHPEDTTLADAWREELPLVVLRVRDTWSDQRTKTYPPVKLEKRRAVDEEYLEPDLGNLLEAVAQKWGQPCAEAGCTDRAESFIDLQTAPVWLRGPLCNEHNQDCLGDNWDASYQLLLPKSLDDGEIYAVAGTLGTETGNATYVGLSINQMPQLKGVMDIPDEDLKGTADGYSQAVNNTDKLFLVYLTRHCSDLPQELADDYCVELPTTKIPEGNSIVVGVRDYIKPGTQRAPDSALVLPSKVLKLHVEPPRDGEMTTAVLSIFEEISQIPRCSKNEAAISNWLVDWADQRGRPVTTDAFKNVLITVPASPGLADQASIVLQSHMDMVCQKEPGSPHDFTKDPIILVRDGDWLGAEATTLGADDGIGMAIALAIADSPSIKHPKLEILVTTDEEVDMTGAAGLSDSLLTSGKYVNIDSETEGVITIGAAGGIKIDLSRPLTFSPLPADQTVFSLEIAGLLGGHSGLHINKGRANANYLAAQALAGTVPLRLINFVGGSADNVITQSSEIRFAVSPSDEGTLQSRIDQFEQDARAQYPAETGMTVTLTALSNTAQPAASEADSANSVSLIASLPQGVYEWSTDLPGQAETSDNIGIVKTESGALDATTFARSFDPAKLESIAALIETTAATYGASSVRRSAFPAWPPNTDSALYNTFLSSYQDLFGIPMTSEIVHAGLECGYIAEKYPGMQIVSIGPTLQDVHSTKERLYVPSLEEVVELLAEVMRRP